MSLNHLYLCFDLIDDRLDHKEIPTTQPHYTDIQVLIIEKESYENDEWRLFIIQNNLISTYKP